MATLRILFNAANALEMVAAGLDQVETKDRFRLAASFKHELENFGHSGSALPSKFALNDGLIKTLRSIRHSDALEQAYDNVRHALIARAQEKANQPKSTALAIVRWHDMSRGQRITACDQYARTLPDRFSEHLPFAVTESYAARTITQPPELVTDIVTGEATAMVMNVEAEEERKMLGYTLRVNTHPASDFSNGLNTFAHLYGEAVNLSLREILKPQFHLRENYNAIASDINIMDTAKKFGVDYAHMPFSLGEAYQEHFTVRLVERQMQKYAEEMKDMIDRNIDTIMIAKHKPGFLAHLMR